MAGQSVGMVKEVRTATTIIENLIAEAVEALAARDRTKAIG